MTADIPIADEIPAVAAAPSDALAAEFERFIRAAQANPPHEQDGSLRSWLELAEAWRIAQALRQTGGNRSAAARILGIGRRTLYAKMDRLGIGPIWSVVNRSTHD